MTARVGPSGSSAVTQNARKDATDVLDAYVGDERHLLMLNFIRSLLSSRDHSLDAIFKTAKLKPEQIAHATTISSDFDNTYYLENNKDVVAANHNPLVHYVKNGFYEGRRPTRDFDPAFYRSRNRHIPKTTDPFLHYITVGRDLGLLTKPDVSFHFTDDLVQPNGVVPSRRPFNDSDFAFAVPFREQAIRFSVGRVAAQIHAFYPDLLHSILPYLDNIPAECDLFISTDTMDKSVEIASILSTYNKGRFSIRVLPNVGRDIAPMISFLPEICADYDLMLHIHTKKSPHGGDPLANWRDYLLTALLGSESIVASIFTIFDQTKAGVVFPQHLFDLRGILNWGFDYDHASRLLRRLGVVLDKDMILEFPSGSMFWAKTAALQPLADLGLSADDFSQEAGQVDGTLAHAIERSLLMIAEQARFQWAKVIHDAVDYPHPKTAIAVGDINELKAKMPAVYRPLLQRPTSGSLPTERSFPETRTIIFHPSDSPRPRLNLLVPTINPSQVFGGVATALALFHEMRKAWAADADFRIIATDASVESDALSGFPGFHFKTIDPYDDNHQFEIVDAFIRDSDRLDLRENDTFIATAWWTAAFSKDAIGSQRRFFGSEGRFIYLIQDYEPNFYGWGSRWVMTENTYKNFSNAIALINSEELYSFFSQSSYRFIKTFYLPYRIDSRLNKLIAPATRQRLILIYGRPSVSRNAFELLMDGLVTWQRRNPVLASNWRIMSAGAEFPEDYASPAQNLSILGKLSMDEYAYWLGRASIGISLMISPHPSYPPLEMAEAGLMTITNAFEAKETSSRFANLHYLSDITADEISNVLERFSLRYENGQYPLNTGRQPREPVDHASDDLYDVSKIRQYVKGLPPQRNDLPS